MKSLESTAYRNPKDGTEILVVAGTAVAIAVSVENNANRPRDFSVQIMGIPESWVDPSTLDQKVGAQGEHVFFIRILPPTRAPGGSHRVNIRVLLEGEYDDSLPELNLTLLVEAVAPSERLPMSEPESEVPDYVTEAVAEAFAPSPSHEPSISDAAMSEPDVKTPAADPRQNSEPEATPTVVSSAPTSPTAAELPAVEEEAPPPPKRKAPMPSSPKPEANPSGRAPEPPKPPSDARTSPKVVSVDDEEEDAPPPEPLPKPKLPPPKETPKATPTARTIVDLPEEPEPEEVAEAEVEAEEADLSSRYQQVVSVDGEVPALWMKPGESVLIRFPFKNTGKRQVTYVIEEDHSLDVGWIQLVTQQINLAPLKSGWVSASVTIPPATRPDTFHFQLRVGPHGGPLTPYEVTLIVNPLLGVHLKAETESVWIGPMHRGGEFVVKAQSTGNADTAYRLAFDGTSREDAKAVEPIYASGHWRYLVDKELENLKSPPPGRPPVFQSHRVTIRREGTWWFGFVERHTARIVGMPVTDRTGHLTAGMSTDLTVKRWRVLPFPWWLSLVFGGLLMTSMVGFPTKLTVDNALEADSLPIDYVVDNAYHPNTVNMPVRLSYDAPWYASVMAHREHGVGKTPETLRSIGSHSITDNDVEVAGTDYADGYSYQISSFFQANKLTASVLLIPWRTQGMLQITDVDSGRTLNPIGTRTVRWGKEKFRREIEAPVYRIYLGTSGIAHVGFRNIAERLQTSRVHVFTAHFPTGFEQDPTQVNVTWKKHFDIAPETTEVARFILRDYSAAAHEDRGWEVLTTDATKPVIFIQVAFGRGPVSLGGAPALKPAPIAKAPVTTPPPVTRVTPSPARPLTAASSGAPINLTVKGKDDPSRTAILDAAHEPGAAFFGKAGDPADLTSGHIQFVVQSLWMSHDKQFEVLKAWGAKKGGAGSKTGRELCALLHKAGGAWQVVQVGFADDADSIKGAHPEAPPELFK